MPRRLPEFTAKMPRPRPDPIPATARNMPGGAAQTPTTAAQMTGGQGYGANFVPLFVEIFRSAKGIFVDNTVEVFTKYTGGREIPFISPKSLPTPPAGICPPSHQQFLIPLI